MYDKLAIGDPIHLAREKTVSKKALLLKGACKRIPTMGRIHVVMVLDCWPQGYQSLPVPQRVSHP
jgi:hypothetical protein